MVLFSFLLAALAVADGTAAVAVPETNGYGHHGPVVHLDYASYQGKTTRKGINEWFGMRFAAPPVGNLRFAAPQDPPRVYGVQNAKQHGPVCLATNSTADGQSEDCLFIDVYAPTKAHSRSKLPVYFFIQGGGFNTNSNPNYNGTGLIKASDDNIVVVNFNYRVGPYGFLAGKEIEEKASLNNGLKDQLKALQWVQKYISQFGGDPNHVVIGGDSAGAASVAHLLSAYGGRDDGLFHASAAESVSFASVRTVAEMDFAYEALLKRAHCKNLKCLRSLSAKKLQSINFNIPYPGLNTPPLYLYAPVIDNDLVPDLTYNLFMEGKFIKVPTIFGADMNDGTIFVPQDTNTLKQSNNFLRQQWPALTEAQLNVIDYFYPKSEQFPDSGAYWRQGANAYGDMRYKCPGLSLSASYAASGLKAWNYLYNVTDRESAREGYGVSHTIEVNAIWGPENTNGGAPDSYFTYNKNAVRLMQGYWTSFIRSFDPNKYRAEGTPRWEEFKRGAERSISIETHTTHMIDVETDTKERCGYFAGIGPSIKQ